MSFTKKPKTIDPSAVDPSVYYYDEVYDEMKEKDDILKDDRKNLPEKRNKPSKYIQGLEETAKLRKTEHDLRKYNKYARDREKARAEGCSPDEEVYITPAYSEKLNELKRLEDERAHRLQQEKNSSMNFTKINHPMKEKLKDNPATPGPSNEQSDSRYTTSGATSNVTSKNETKTSHTSLSTSKKCLKTIEDRREYLRELLKKRTVGKEYEQAVERYINRKAETASR